MHVYCTISSYCKHSITDKFQHRENRTQNVLNVWKYLNQNFSKLKDNSPYQYFQAHKFSQEQKNPVFDIEFYENSANPR